MRVCHLLSGSSLHSKLTPDVWSSMMGGGPGSSPNGYSVRYQTQRR